MLRTRTLLALFALLIALAPAAVADDEVQLATDEEAKEALAVFKKEYKAKGLKGDDKLMQRDFAMKNLVKTQHKMIADELGKLVKKNDEDIRTLAVIYLGEMRGVPGTAGKHIVAAMKKHKKDTIFLMSALDAVGYLRYLGAGDEIVDLMNHKDFALKKYAIRSAGWIQDIRLMPALLKLLGIEVKADKGDSGKESDKGDGGKEAEVEEGYSWDGVEVNYDTGTPGDHDQKMAEKIGKEQLAKNKAAAEAKAGKSGATGMAGASTGGAGGPRTGGGATSRTLEELAPNILKALKNMTGEEFEKGREIKLWLRVNGKKIRELEKRYDRREKAQRKGA
ncbi:MAG: hypothetical protein QNJ98_00045 [Planctomycetota bacterium]|nr:hypothetical protein [Planctomycetota bacterium]